MLGGFLQFHKWKGLSNDVPYNLLSYEMFVPLRVSSVLNDNVLVDIEPANFPRQNEGPLEGYQRKLVSFAWSLPRARSPKSQDVSQGQMVWLTRGAGLSAVRWPYLLTGSSLQYSQLANCSCIDGGVVRFCGHKHTRAGGLGTFSQRNTSLIGSSAQFNHSKELEPKTVLQDSNGKVYSC